MNRGYEGGLTPRPGRVRALDDVVCLHDGVVRLVDADRSLSVAHVRATGVKLAERASDLAADARRRMREL
jgi:hypothetical protein